MKLKNIASNMSEVTLGNQNGEFVVLFSYSTPVAYVQDGRWYRTAKHYSKTTTRHINKWLRLNNQEGAITCSQSWINNLVTEGYHV
mgnify:CR=1 FL=1|jgi:hypothetical protein|tara:strand:+ start:65 stop:322 length:258 start_codon:yes stop_codon:yes gene_type:complete